MTTEEKLAQVQKEKQMEEAIKLDAIKNKEEDDKMRLEAIALWESKRNEMMQPYEAITVESLWTWFLTKEAVSMFLQIKTNEYFKFIQKICVDNPIIIKVNQDMALEIEEKLSNLTDDYVINQTKRSLSSALYKINQLRDEIDMDNVWKVLEQHIEMLKQVKAIYDTL